MAITTNIESVEYRRRESSSFGYEEHPRASTSDDVEAIIALFYRFLGAIFTVKEFKAHWRRVSITLFPVILLERLPRNE